MGKHRVTEDVFRQVKRDRFTPKWYRAKKYGLHLSTVINIVGSRNFAQYRELVISEHQPTKFSIADEVLTIHRMLFNTQDGYVRPRSARQAVLEIKDLIRKRG